MLCATLAVVAPWCGYAQSAPQPEDSQRQSGTQPNSPAAADDSNGPETLFPEVSDTRYWLSGQANFIWQSHPAFPALYSGPNSLNPNFEQATSRVLTLYGGVRLNQTPKFWPTWKKRAVRR